MHFRAAPHELMEFTLWLMKSGVPAAAITHYR